MLVQPQVGHIELAQVCSCFALDETFETRLKFVRFTRHAKPCVSTRNLLLVIFNRYLQIWCLLIKIETLNVSDCFSMLLFGLNIFQLL